MWTQSKDLHNLVENTINSQQEESLIDFEKALKKHRSDFSALLKHPPKNATDRNLLVKSVKEPVIFPGRKSQVSLDQAFVDETLIISDMFGLNENLAMELLHTAEQQMNYYPDLTRGLISVLLYYDARRAIVNSLKILVQARKGISWAVDTSDKIVTCITNYTDKLVEKGLVDQILGLLEQLNLEKEINLLHENRALGSSKHRRQVNDFFIEIRQSLADIVFCWAAQNGLSKESTLLLANYLSNVSVLDNVNVTLLMAFYYAIDISAVVRTEESEEVVRMLPITSDNAFVPAVQKCLMESSPWKNVGLQGAVQLAWAVTLATFRSLSSAICAPIQSQVDEDETILDTALDGKALNFLSNLLQTNNNIHKEEFYLRRLHSLITDLIVQMPLKIKDLRNKADEVARNILMYQQEGLEPPANLPLHFQSLLNFIAVLYGEDPLELELCLEFWSSDMANAGVNYRVSQRQMALYKFIRLAGDLLPPSLYIAYASMLCGLANGKRAAHQAFTLLKQNSGGGGGSLISWEHFFASLHRYFSSLRQESLPVPDTIYRHKPLTKGITPQEVQGLQVVLKLMRIILFHDSVARISLAENPTWLPLVVMIGLLGCAVPLSLKAEIMEVLAAFAQSPDIAYTLWSSIETAQILATTSSVSSNIKGLQTELEDVESRSEEYPLTRAFLKLLDTMTNVPIPANLGSGHRTPGFDPYLFYVKDFVFLKFSGRAYRNDAEKWQISSACIKLFLKLLNTYEPSVEDFQDAYIELPTGGNVVRCKSPGYHLLVQCLHDSNFLRLILGVVDEGCRVLDLYSSVPGVQELENTTLNILLLLKRVFQLQDEFLELIRRLGSALRVVTLDSLLLGINSRTGKPDHMINIGKLVTMNQHLPQHALAALNIIRRVASAPSTQNQLLALYTKSPALTSAIRYGFVEALEMVDSNDSSNASVEQETEVPNASQGCRLVVLHLLTEGVNLPHPSLAHFLLGFNTQSPLSKTVLQQPGIQDQPRTCLHALLGILEKNIESSANSAGSRVIELAYKLLYQLCSHPNISDIVLRFLRSSDFLGRQVAALPFTDRPEWSQLSQMSWLLKSVAVEIKITSDKGLGSHVNKMASRFLCEKDEFSDAMPMGEITDRSLLSGTSYLGTQDQLTVRSRPKIALLLDCVNLMAAELSPPTMEFFDPGAIEALVKQCEIVSEEGVQLTKMSLLQSRLRSELANLINVALGQRQLIMQEVQNVLSFVKQRNNIRLEVASRRFYLEGWRQVLESLLATGSLNDLSHTRWNILTQITQDIFSKCLAVDNTLPDLVHYLSGVMVILLAGLRTCALESAKESDFLSSSTQVPSDYVKCLDGTILRNPTDRTASTRGGSGSSATINVIQRQLVDWISRAGGSAHRVRINLYSALLNSLRISNQTTELAKWTDPSLLQTLVRDCSSGHEVQRMLALSLLDQLAAADNQGPIASFLSSKGYLKHMVNSLPQLDSGLIAALEYQPNMDGLRTMYVYESQMGLLTRLASSQKGALVLLDSSIFQRLSEMSVFSQRPDFNPNNSTEGTPFIPDTAQRFNQIMFPALQLSSTMLTSLGNRHRTGCSEVVHFLLAHSETVGAILRNRSISPIQAYLEETALLTAVVSRATGFNLVNGGLESQASVEIRGQLSRLEHVTLNLLPIYVNILGENVLTEFGLVPTKLCLQVTVNILKLARSLTNQNRVIFAPSFDRPNKTSLSLGILTKSLLSNSVLLIIAQEKSEICRRRLESIQDLTTQQLAEILPPNTDEKLPAHVRRMIGTKTLEQELKNWDELLELCSLVLESTTWLLWHHMEQYFHSKRNLTMGGPPPLLTSEDVIRLKREAGGHLSTFLFKKLNECEQVYLQKKGRHGFVQALLRRIKRLLSV